MPLFTWLENSFLSYKASQWQEVVIDQQLDWFGLIVSQKISQPRHFTPKKPVQN